MAETTEQPKIIKDLKKHPCVIVEGVIHTLSPITTVDNMEKELTRQIEVRLKKSKTDELIQSELAKNIEFLTSNNFIVFFTLDNLYDTLVIAKEFAGGIIEHKKREEENDDDDEEHEDRIITTKVYVPDGYLGIRINIKEFPKIETCTYFIWPKIKSMSPKQSYITHGRFYREIHPHVHSDGRLCSGQKGVSIFSIDNIISTIDSAINGNINKDGTTATILSYNKHSPAINGGITSCDKGIHAAELFEKYKDNDKVIKELIGGN